MPRGTPLRPGPLWMSAMWTVQVFAPLTRRSAMTGGRVRGAKRIGSKSAPSGSAHEEVVAAERPGVREVGFAARELVVHLQVAHVALHGLAASGELVDHARLGGGEDLRGDAERVEGRAPFAVGRVEDERVLAREGRVEEEQTAVLSAAVVSAGHEDDLVRIVGDGARAAEEGGEVGTAAPEGELAHAVGVHRH